MSTLIIYFILFKNENREGGTQREGLRGREGGSGGREGMEGVREWREGGKEERREGRRD